MAVKYRSKNGTIASPYPDDERGRFCSTCEQHFPKDFFYKDRRGVDGLMRRCKTCHIYQSYKSRKRSAKSQSRDYWRRIEKRYGLSKDEYWRIAKSQDFKCKICKNPPKGHPRLVIDHDHQTGKWRGLLCNRCNTAIGSLDDNPETIIRAAKYIEGLL